MLTGKTGERIAQLHLMRKGYKTLERNYRSRIGEIDIIVRKGDTLVFCEVKTRTDKQFGEPYEAVTKYKQERIARLAEQYLASRSFSDVDCRFDVISVLLDERGKPTQVEHIEGGFFCKAT